MLEKLLVRVRSWLHVDPAAATAGAGSGVGAGPLVGAPPPLAPRSAPTARPATSRPAAAAVTPPPLPGEAFSLAMEPSAQTESGMVITESGIIIIDPNAAEAESSTSKRADANDSAWALPAFTKNAAPPPTPPQARSSSSGDDWDTVLARARERLASGPGSTRK